MEGLSGLAVVLGVSHKSWSFLLVLALQVVPVAVVSALVVVDPNCCYFVHLCNGKYMVSFEFLDGIDYLVPMPLPIH